MKLKVFMFGAEGVGKTELRKHLALPDYVNKPGMLYYRSIAPDFDTAKISNIPNLPDVGNVDIDIWDTSGNLHFKNISANMFYSRSHFGLFCIDLSKPLTPEIIRELEIDLDLFKEENPEALLFLVGTKSDVALLDALKNAQEQFTHIPFTASIHFSERTKWF